jgi:hypothetical protein
LNTIASDDEHVSVFGKVCFITERG